jgi:hypothetical protein
METERPIFFPFSTEAAAVTYVAWGVYAVGTDRWVRRQVGGKKSGPVRETYLRLNLGLRGVLHQERSYIL